MNEDTTLLSNDLKKLNDWLNKSDQILTHGKDVLGADLRKIFYGYKLTGLCNSFVSGVRKRCVGEIILDVMKQKQNRLKLDSVNKCVKIVNDVAKRISAAKDVKEPQDLSNALQTQIAPLQVDKLMFDIQKNADEQQQSVLEKQK